MEQVRIQTTQNVRIDYDLATLGDRFFAWVIDVLILAAYVITVLLIADVLGLNLDPLKDTGAILNYLLLFLPMTCYHLLMECFFNGQSVGKMALKIKVVRLDGSQPTIGGYIFRWMSRIIEFSLLPGLAMFVYMFSLKGQRLGDIVAGTTVVRMKRKVTLEDTALAYVEDDYIPMFPQARSLSHRDIEIIREAFKFSRENNNYHVMSDLHAKVKEVLDVEHTMSFEDFLGTVIKDFNYYQQQ